MMTPTDTQFESVRVMQTTISEECRLLEAASPLPSFHFHSILFERAEDETSEESTEPPEFFHDLNLDQIVDAITAGRSEYNLKPFFYKRPRNLTCILYRQQIMRDLEKQSLLASIKSFSNQMRSVRLHLNASEKIHYEYGRKAWFLDAVELYCEAVLELGRSLNRDEPSARGLRAFQEYLTQYTESEGFKALVQETKAVKSKLSTICNCLPVCKGFYGRGWQFAIPEADWQAFHERIDGLIHPVLQSAEYAHQHPLCPCAAAAAVALHHLSPDRRRLGALIRFHGHDPAGRLELFN